MSKKISETIAENIFRDFYGNDIFIEKTAIPNEYGFKSKNKTGKKGYPDFLYDTNEYIIVVEAKANDQKTAEDELQFYMNNNEINKDIIGIAISGQSKKDYYATYFIKDVKNDILDRLNVDRNLLTLDNINKIYKRYRYKSLTTTQHLNKILSNINEEFQNAGIRDTERSLFFSGIMIALKDNTFRNIYKSINKPEQKEQRYNITKLSEAHYLNENIIEAINRQLNSKINNMSKEYNWKDKFSFIKNIDYSLIKYINLINNIEDNIFIPFENEEKQDVLGKAYKIFLSRAGKVDNKNIIITPDHIKSLMIKLANLNIDDVILDTCTGTGGFLMESMETLIKLAKGNNDKINKIKENNLIGFENDPVLFALACSNMFLHGDGRTNLIFRSSILDYNKEYLIDSNYEELFNYVKSKKPTKIIINPPYESNKPIKFVLNAIDYLEQNGKLIIIMPTPTLTHNIDIVKNNILNRATLDFVIKMPEKLFSEQKRTVNTSIFGFTKEPHINSKSVVFYNLKDDGFISIQHKGRIDLLNDWKNKEEQIINSVINKNEIDNICENRIIFNNSEVNFNGFRKSKNSKYKIVKIKELFKNNGFGSLPSENFDILDNSNENKYDFITASSEWKKYNSYDYDCEALVYAVSASGSLGRTHYVNGKFIASNLCIVLTKNKKSKLDINLKFYKYYLESIKEQIKDDISDGSSKLTIKPSDLMEYYIEYIPIKIQNDFYNKYIFPYELLENKLKSSKENLSNMLAKINC